VVMQNLTGVPATDIWSQLGFSAPGVTPENNPDLAKRKKKIMAAGTDNSMQTATQFLFGNRLNNAGNPMA